MIFALTLANASAILTAGSVLGQAGYDTAGAGFGSLNRSPAKVRGVGSEITRLREGGDDTLALWLSGDQTSFLSGKSLFVDATEYAVSGASIAPSYDSGNDRTTVTWSPGASVFVDGQTYIIRVE